MMKTMKKFAAMVLALMMVLAMSVPAFAATDYSITVNNSVDGYTYVAYQIFKGDYDSTNGLLSNIEWGDGVNSSELLAALVSANNGYQKVTITEFTSGTTYYTYDADTDTYTTVTDGATYDGSIDYYVKSSSLTGLFSTITASSSAEDVAEILASSNFSNNSATTIAFSALVETCKTGSGSKLTYTDSAYKLSDIEAGYYLVLNTGVPDEEDNTVYSRYMLRVAGAASVDPKSGVPKSTKTVTDVNDSTGNNSTATGTTADYDIGDKVPFTLDAEVPSYFGGYDTYKLIFHDTLSDGLSFNDDVTVTVGDVTVDQSCYTVAKTTSYQKVTITEFASGTTYYTY
ncbi:MAG: isopeptide-forming domain-containing fimbrial protein, partial [Clostridiales bacterium]|nr:isopeptide-forming domain-containing fimbrial protein [Clostridiales bacterium]